MCIEIRFHVTDGVHVSCAEGWRYSPDLRARGKISRRSSRVHSRAGEGVGLVLASYSQRDAAGLDRKVEGELEGGRADDMHWHGHGHGCDLFVARGWPGGCPRTIDGLSMVPTQ